MFLSKFNQSFFVVSSTLLIFSLLTTAIVLSVAMIGASHAIGTPVDPSESGHIETIGGSISRSAFTRAVVKREPIDEFETLTTRDHHVYFFTELKGMTGQKVTHRWLHNGTTMAEVKFDVGAPRWRVWSSKTLMTEWTGTWTVEVLNGLGQVVYRESFEYVDEAPATPIEQQEPNHID